MRRIKFFSFLLLLASGTATVFFSCSKDGDKTPAIQVKNESALNQTLYADKTEGNTIGITAAGKWSSEIKPQDTPSASSPQQLRATTTWITITPDNGNAGDYTISIVLEINTTGEDRTAIIVIKCDGTEIIITVTQSGKTEDGTVPTKPDEPGAITVTAITLDSMALTLAINAFYTLTATIQPGNATNKTVTWTSSDNSVATVSAGKVTAHSEGTATITAQAGSQSASCDVKVIKDLNVLNDTISSDINGVVINGIRWATRNVDAPGTFAASPEAPGMFYQWNRNVGWSATDPMINSNGGGADTWDDSMPTGDTWETVNDPCPAGWRVPTLKELQKLDDMVHEHTNKVAHTWFILNGVHGGKFTDKVTGNSLFLPAVGFRHNNDGTLFNNAGGSGNYWSSTQDSNALSYIFYFYSGLLTPLTSWHRADGLSCRCVAE